MRIKKALICLLTTLFCWQPLHLNAQAQEARLDLSGFKPGTWLEASSALPPFHQVQPVYQVSQTPPDRTDLWMNATYALGASALSNTLLLLVITGLTLGQEALAPGTPAWLDLAGPAALGLLVVPMFATPLFMHTWSPEAEWEHLSGSMLGTLTMTGAQLALMVPLFVLFHQGNVNDTYWALLPSAFITAILFQALGSAWGHELSQNLSVRSLSGQGLHLTYQLRF